MSWPFCTSGPVPPDSPVYVQREADYQLRQHLLAMDCVLLVAPHQMGKTSLIYRLQAQLAGSSYTIAYADAQKLGNGDKAEWYRSLRSHLPSRLDIKLDRGRQGFRELLQALAKQAENVSKHIVIALDGLSSIPEDFLQTLQWFLIARRTEPRLKNLTLILAEDSAAPILPAQGTSLVTLLTLKDFYRPQVRQLVDFLEVRSSFAEAGSTELAEVITDCIYQWTGGQPYLTQKMCSLLAKGDLPLTIEGVDQAAEKIWKEDTGHLSRILDELKAAPQAREQLKKIIAGEKMSFKPASKLTLIGVVKSDEYSKCTMRNRIYEEAFKRELWPKAT